MMFEIIIEIGALDMMTAEQFWFDGHVCKQHKRGCCDECMQHVARADAHAAAQLAEKEREIARLRFNLYHYAPFNGLAHTTACSIWREDGQGHAEGFEGDRGPCNCGCLENFQRTRAEAAEQRLQEVQAEIELLRHNRNEALKDEDDSF